ncbi:hypothetical protein LDENG_00220820 [Lucifuga dentata]|nr:hypothetical protein LDENG_00220820 [Lucifuga dentata]
MAWGCFAASGPGQLAIIEGNMNSALYQKILRKNVRSSVSDLKLKPNWVMQQDNDQSIRESSPLNGSKGTK